MISSKIKYENKYQINNVFVAKINIEEFVKKMSEITDAWKSIKYCTMHSKYRNLMRFELHIGHHGHHNHHGSGYHHGGILKPNTSKMSYTKTKFYSYLTKFSWNSPNAVLWPDLYIKIVSYAKFSFYMITI